VSGWLALGALEAAVGALLGIPGLLIVGTLTAGFGALTRIWSRGSAGRLIYTRRLGTERAVVGDIVPLEIGIWNQQTLPLPWVNADDLVADGITIRERPELDLDGEALFRRVLRNAWTLSWYEQVVRRFTIDASRRGAYPFGPVRISVRDLLGRVVARETRETPGTLVVAPRTLSVRTSEPVSAPIGDRRATSGLTHDPALFSGVRPFQPGDPLRQVHWRATARSGITVSRRYEPARAREVVIAMDVQTVDGPYWEMSWDDDAFEGQCVAAASLTRQLAASGHAVGLAAAGFVGTEQWVAWLPPRAHPNQVTACTDLLARLGPVSSRPYAYLLTWLARRAPGGATLIALTARDPTPVIPILRRLKASGFDIEIIGFGPGGADVPRLAQRTGLRGRHADLTPDWQTADALLMSA
jgi:uncharacterized protein (DUF58 family)